MTLTGLTQPTPLTLHTIFERMRTIHADGEVASPEGRRSYGEIAERVMRLARALRDDFGIRPGDRVASFGFNTGRHFELYWAVPLLGAVLHTVNVRLYEDQIAYIVNHAEDRVVFVDGELVTQLAEVAPRFQTVERYVRMGDGPEDLTPLDDHDEVIARSAPIDALPEVPEEAACGLCYTSGTTGMPKGVLTSHRAQWLHAMAECRADVLGLTEHDRVFPVVPMFHAFGWGLPYSAPFAGADLIFHGGDNSPETIGGTIARERVTVTAAVPTIWNTVLPLARRGEVDLSSLRNIFIGGAAVPRPLMEAYDALGVEIVQLWGMTETGPLACVSRPRRHHRGLSERDRLDIREKTGTIMAGVEARIVAPDGTVLPWDGKSVGELEVRGPWIASAYYNDESSDERFHDGWLRTGDMAWMEPDGYFRIVDRAKDLVKSGGEWISSVELEGLLLGHPRVRDAAVVGIRSRKWDERPVAVVVPEGEPPTLDEVHDYLTPMVAKWWLPDDLVVVEEIPRTSVGKIDKKVLRAQLNHMELP